MQNQWLAQIQIANKNKEVNNTVGYFQQVASRGSGHLEQCPLTVFEPGYTFYIGERKKNTPNYTKKLLHVINIVLELIYTQWTSGLFRRTQS